MTADNKQNDFLGCDQKGQGHSVVSSEADGVTTVEIHGEKYIVALDGQTARLWEKKWGLKKA